MVSALRAVLSLTGALAGYLSFGAAAGALGWSPPEPWLSVARYAATALVCVLCFVSAGYIANGLVVACDRAERAVSGLTFAEAAVACAGLVAGLAVAFFLALPISKDNWIGLLATILLNFLLGYAGLSIALRKRRDAGAEGMSGIAAGADAHASLGAAALAELSQSASKAKLLDTSAVIDGRVADIIRTGFLDGQLVIPEFALDELRHLADSKDPIKRGKGRRGLDILKAMQDELGDRLRVDSTPLPEGAEVDAELVRMAQRQGCDILTTDYNLNKVASVQGVHALNVNDLSNAVRQPVAPGEEMSVRVVKDGKEPGQGVAYLSDGTMVVVEGGRLHMGDEIAVTLTSILQTSAGRMAFAVPKGGLARRQQ